MTATSENELASTKVPATMDAIKIMGSLRRRRALLPYQRVR